MMQKKRITLDNHNPVTIIGTGPVARSLGWALFQAGYPISSVIGQYPTQVRNLGKILHAQTSDLSVQEISKDSKIIILAVSDDQIISVSQELTKLDFLDSTCTVIHCSGALSADIMAPLRARKVKLMSFHPMMTFAQNSRRKSFRGVYIGIEGDSNAMPLGFQIAEDIGAIPIEIPTEWKTTYHLSAVWASNFLVGLMQQAISLLEKTGYDRATSWKILEPLVKGTLDNIHRLGIEGTLTGPARRGDINTIQRHLEQLETKHPELLEPYRLWTETLIRECASSPGLYHQKILEIVKDS
jgi:predicted short-subunit dehydrogenase-like oxidoreductase (DUF2520 family)